MPVEHWYIYLDIVNDHMQVWIN